MDNSKEIWRKIDEAVSRAQGWMRAPIHNIVRKRRPDVPTDAMPVQSNMQYHVTVHEWTEPAAETQAVFDTIEEARAHLHAARADWQKRGFQVTSAIGDSFIYWSDPTAKWAIVAILHVVVPP